MKIYAHRGASGDYPENTMLAFRKAVEMGAEGIETDVHLSKDGQLVLCHDETIDRTTNRSGAIADMTYAELLHSDAGIPFGAQFTGEPIPLLRDLLRLGAESGIEINLELKNYIIDYPALEQRVIDEVKEFYSLDKIILSSFRHLSMVRAKQICPAVKTGLLYCCDLYHPGSYAEHCRADALHPDYTTLSAETMAQAKEYGLMVNVYTVDEEQDIRYMQEMGVDVLMTNYPSRGLALRQQN